jgi:hypothetical protein
MNFNTTNMKTIFSISIILILGITSVKLNGQSDSSISSSLDLYVFPTNDQSTEQQDKDEYECFKWAKEKTGYDPMNPTKVEAEQSERGPDGSAVVGAAGGAAAGAAIGAIAGDTGKGAAIGAIVGGLRGNRARRYGQAVEQAQNDQAATQAEEKLLNDFKKAFSACMEGKGYTVK